MTLRPVKASEIGLHRYCRRAWWYQRQGVPSQNQAALDHGSTYHRRHGQGVLAGDLLRWAAAGLLLLALVLAAVALTLTILG